jgi:hypothetical protein
MFSTSEGIKIYLDLNELFTAVTVRENIRP